MKHKAPKSPTTDDIAQARQDAGLTHKEAAAVVYAAGRTWQHWEAGTRAMPPGLFELFRLKTGLSFLTE